MIAVPLSVTTRLKRHWKGSPLEIEADNKITPLTRAYPVDGAVNVVPLKLA